MSQICDFCGKIYSKKSNLTKHERICKVKSNPKVLSMKNQLEEALEKISELEEIIDKKERKIKTLREKLSSAKDAVKNTFNANTTTNINAEKIVFKEIKVIKKLCHNKTPITNEFLEDQYVKLTRDEAMGGVRGFVTFMLKNIVVVDEGGSNIVLTDINRQRYCINRNESYDNKNVYTEDLHARSLISDTIKYTRVAFDYYCAKETEPRGRKKSKYDSKCDDDIYRQNFNFARTIGNDSIKKISLELARRLNNEIKRRKESLQKRIKILEFAPDPGEYEEI